MVGGGRWGWSYGRLRAARVPGKRPAITGISRTAEIFIPIFTRNFFCFLPTTAPLKNRHRSSRTERHRPFELQLWGKSPERQSHVLVRLWKAPASKYSGLGRG